MPWLTPAPPLPSSWMASHLKLFDVKSEFRAIYVELLPWIHLKYGNYGFPRACNIVNNPIKLKNVRT